MVIFEIFRNISKQLKINIIFILDQILFKKRKVDKMLTYLIEIRREQSEMKEKMVKMERKLTKIQKKITNDDSDNDVLEENFIKVCFFIFCFNINNNFYIDSKYFQKQEFCTKNFGEDHQRKYLS